MNLQPNLKIGRLTLIRPATPRGGQWLCRCDCDGKEIKLKANILRRSGQLSCGCLRKERAREVAANNTTHGCSGHPLYSVWRGMIARCNDTKNDKYTFYGMIGIEVCARWSDPETGLKAFIDDVGERPLGHVLGRINTLGNYSPDNFKWITDAQTDLNDGSSCRIPGSADRLSYNQIAQITGLTRHNVVSNLRKYSLATVLMMRADAA